MKTLSSLGQYTLLCISSLTIMVGTLLAPGLVSIANGLGIDESPVLLITLPSLGAVIFAPLAGRLIDKYGSYTLTLIGLFLYGSFGVSVYFFENSTFIFINRFLLGGATAIVMAGCTTLISQWYEGENRLKMLAKQGMAIELGGVIFLFLGGYLASKHWGLPFLLYTIAWAFLAMQLLFVPRAPMASSAGKHVATNSPTPVATGLSLTGVYILAILAMTVFFTSTVILPISMSNQYFNESQIGSLLAFISLIAVITAGFMPKITKQFGNQLVLGFAFFAFSLAYFCFVQENTFLLIIGAVFIGIGFGFSIPLLNHMTVELSAENVRGRNLSYFTMAVFSGQFLTSFMKYIPGGVDKIFIICAIFSAVITIILLFQRLKNQRDL